MPTGMIILNTIQKKTRNKQNVTGTWEQAKGEEQNTGVHYACLYFSYISIFQNKKGFILATMDRWQSYTKEQ